MEDVLSNPGVRQHGMRSARIRRRRPDPGRRLVVSACLTIATAIAALAMHLAIGLALYVWEGPVRYGLCRYLYHTHQGLGDGRNQYGLAERYCGGWLDPHRLRQSQL